MFFTVKDRSRVKAEAYMPEVIKALEPKPMIQEILKEHDEIFGYTTKDIEENEPSTHGGAGCDDCYESQKLRAKSRAFLEKSLKRVAEEAVRNYRVEIVGKLSDARCFTDARSVLLSNPPQHRCDACLRYWIVGEKPPICDYIRKADIINLNSQSTT